MLHNFPGPCPGFVRLTGFRKNKRGAMNDNPTRKQGNLPDTGICARSVLPDGWPSPRFYLYAYAYGILSVSTFCSSQDKLLSRVQLQSLYDNYRNAVFTFFVALRLIVFVSLWHPRIC